MEGDERIGLCCEFDWDFIVLLVHSKDWVEDCAHCPVIEGMLGGLIKGGQLAYFNFFVLKEVARGRCMSAKICSYERGLHLGDQERLRIYLEPSRSEDEYLRGNRDHHKQYLQTRY
jgi:hypothetical protein